MKRRLTAALAVLLMAALPASCGDPQVFSDSETLSGSYTRAQNALPYHYADGAQEPPNAYAAYANSVTDFSLRQLRFHAQEETASFVFSPAVHSLQAALLANAASKDTRQEILQALGGGALTLDDLNACSSYFKSRMESVSQDETARVALRSAVFIDEAVDVRSAFLQANADYYGSDVFRSDYSGEYAAQKLNNYLAPFSAGSGFTPSGSVNGIAVCTVSDNWLEASSEAATGVFHGESGDAAMPFFTTNAKLLHSGKATGVLKYTKNNPLKLLVAMPGSDTAFDDYLNSFDNTELRTLLDSMDVTQSAAVTLPVFSVDGGKQAAPCSGFLGKSGLFSLFGKKAGFSALSYTQKADLGDLYEITAAFSLDRSGVNTAVSAPAVTVAGKEALTVDRPFLFFLLDNETNLPVLAGCYR